MPYHDAMEVPRPTLRDLVVSRISEVTAGNKAAYARRLGVTPQVLNDVVKVGGSLIPKRPFRDELAADLGISVLEIFLMAGEIEDSDIPGRPEGVPVTPSRAASLCHQVRKIDWDRVAEESPRYVHLAEELDWLAERYPVQQET